MTRRTERVNDVIRAELSQMILRELNDPRIGGLVSITEVDAAPDFRNAKVKVSVMGDEAQQKAALQGLRSAALFMHRGLRTRLATKNTPRLTFQLDHSMERASRVLELINEIEVAPEP